MLRSLVCLTFSVFFAQNIYAQTEMETRTAKTVYLHVNPFDYLHLLPNMAIGASIHEKVTAELS